MAQRSLKEQLVEGGTGVLFERGFHASSINDIVEAAKVPKGSFYNHFESKEAFALEVVRRYAESYETASLRAEGDPLAQLRAHFEAVIERTVNRGVTLGCLLGNFSTEVAMHSTAIRAYVGRALASWSDAIVGSLVRARDAGQLPAGLDPEAFGHFLIDSFEGAVARAKLTGTREPLDRFLAVTFGGVLAGPGKRAAASRSKARR